MNLSSLAFGYGMNGESRLAGTRGVRGRLGGRLVIHPYPMPREVGARFESGHQVGEPMPREQHVRPAGVEPRADLARHA